MTLLWIVLFLGFLLVAFCMVGLILLQEGKGGGLTGNAGGMDAVMGARNPLRRWTAYFFVAFVVLAISLNLFYHHSSERRRVMQGDADDETPPANSPASAHPNQLSPNDLIFGDDLTTTTPVSPAAETIESAGGLENEPPEAPATAGTTAEPSDPPPADSAPTPEPVSAP